MPFQPKALSWYLAPSFALRPLDFSSHISPGSRPENFTKGHDCAGASSGSGDQALRSSVACLTLPSLWLQRELERTFSHWIIPGLHPFLALNQSAPLPPPLTPSHSQAHIAKQLASKREAGEGYLFLASSLRRPQGAGNLLASSDQPSEQALPLYAHPGFQTTLPARGPYRMLSCLGFAWLSTPHPHLLSSHWLKGM